MAAIMLVHTSISVTKMLRDDAEAEKMVNKLENANTEKLLTENTEKQ